MLDSCQIKKCPRCKYEKEHSDFHKNKNRCDGLNGFCKSCMKEYKYPDYHRDRCVSPIGKFSNYKSSARERDIEWKLDYDDFMCFWKSDCFYCGLSIETIGIDRKNNRLGYEVANVVSCCKTCNYAKGTLTWQEWNMYREQLSNYHSHEKVIFVDFKVRVDPIKTQYGNYKRGAERRGLNFNISIKEFEQFSRMPCNYCGIVSNTIGIDRKNNYEGYTLDNLVSCCKICNRAKGVLALDEWANWIEAICRELKNAKKKSK